MKRSVVGMISNFVILLIVGSVFSFAFMKGTVDANAPTEQGAIYQGNIANRNISLMINVYWGNEYIEPMLQVLSEKNAKTTFFVGGSWVAKNDELLSKIVSAGHELGNHGFNHRDQNKLSLQENKQEIKSTHDLVFQLTGIAMTLFAPPSGAFSNNTLVAAYDLGYKTIMWTRDTIDWRDKNATIIYNRAVKNPQNGDLILMHPTAETLKALPDIVTKLQSFGFQIVPVGQNLA